MNDLINNKNILFISTKNLDYIRNVQEIELIKHMSSSYTIIGSNSKSYIKRLIKIFFKIISTSCKKYDVIFIGFAPQLILPLFYWKFKKKYIIIDFFISLYDTFVFDRKKICKDSNLAKFIKFVDRKTICCANHVVVDTNEHGKYFIEEFSVSRKCIETIYLQADKNIFYPRNHSSNVTNKKFTVLYFGSILPLQGVDIILKAIEILNDRHDINFIIIGPLGDKYKIINNCHTTYYHWVSQDNLAELISESDLCLAGHFNKSIPKANRTIPGKAYIYKSMEKPMILGENPANRELFSDDERTNFFVEMGDPKALANKIIYIKEKLRNNNGGII